jgi:RNA polymerase sigma-70 factor, ECF subfamily
LAEVSIGELLAAGEREKAFELLVATLSPRIFRLACSYVKDEAMAEDISQEVFVRVWRALPDFRGDAQVETWVYAITRNLCLSSVRRLGVERARDGGTPDDFKVRADRQARPGDWDLERALEALPEPSRQILTLFYFQEQSYEEVAAMLHMPLGTVKTKLHRARNLLREALFALGAGSCV